MLDGFTNDPITGAAASTTSRHLMILEGGDDTHDQSTDGDETEEDFEVLDETEAILDDGTVYVDERGSYQIRSGVVKKPGLGFFGKTIAYGAVLSLLTIILAIVIRPFLE